MDGARVRYVFLDRDGVINRKLPEGTYLAEWSQFSWLPGAIEAMIGMLRAGLTLIVVTNQRGIALHLYTRMQLEEIHSRMQAELAEHGARLHAIYYCPHDNGECCCRKPGTGMLEQAFRDFPQANADNSVMIGDSLSDIQAGKKLGMQAIFIAGDPDRQKSGAAQAAALADEVAPSLHDAVQTHLGIGHVAGQCGG